LLGTRGVQTTDDQVHAHRKRMFLELMTPARLAALSSAFTEELITAATSWGSAERVILYDALHEVLTRTVCRWAGRASSRSCSIEQGQSARRIGWRAMRATKRSARLPGSSQRFGPASTILL
jgi:cytochrome P450